jgi:phosphatidylserine/phosphatidylglycerophosphate/cardiolipin synthase-like enzyme
VKILSGFSGPMATGERSLRDVLAAPLVPELRRVPAYRAVSSLFRAAVPGIASLWRRQAAALGAYFPRLPIAMPIARDVAAPGFKIPLRIDLSGLPLWADPYTRPRKLRFDAIGPDGSALPLGEAKIDENGTALVQARFPEAGGYDISYRLYDIAYEIPEKGRVDVLDGGRGIVAVDADELVALHGAEQFVSLMNSYAGRYRLVAVTEDEGLRDELAAAGLNSPVVANDYASSPFWLPGRRFPEAQLEKLKRLKFVAGLPVVGVITRKLASVRGYGQAGIETIPLETFGSGSDEWFDTARTEALDGRFTAFSESLKKPPREFYLDGMTGSRKTIGNDVRFFTENAAARKELFRLINGARSFIHVANFGFQSDEFGRAAMELLIHRARQGVKVRVIMDAACFAPYPTERGFSWMDGDLLARMREAGIAVVMHRVFDPGNAAIPHAGPFSRRHRKSLIVDFAEGDADPEIVAFGGGRIIGGLSYSDPVVKETGYFGKWIGFGWGEFRDLSFRVTGPEAGAMGRKFIEDFRNYGGTVSIADESRLAAAAPRPSGGSILRTVFHDAYSEQNTHNVVMDYLADPDATSVTLVNSFAPTEEILQAMIRAARDGKKVRYVTGIFLFGYFGLRQNAQRLIDAGVEVVVVPYQLHTKLYSNGTEYAYGNQNLDQWSQHDSEDLQIIERDLPQAGVLDGYVESLVRDGFVLNERFQPGEDPGRVKQFLSEILDSYHPNAWMTTEHPPWRAALYAAEFLIRAPFLK